MKITYDIVVGIDIGLTGGIAFFDGGSGEQLSLYPMPVIPVPDSKGKMKNKIDLEKLLHLLEIPKVHNDKTIVVFENVSAFPGQGVVAVGTLLEQKGILRGMSHALGYDELPISPKTWQGHFDIVCPKEIKVKQKRKQWLKEKSLEIAREKFPNLAETKLEKSTAHGLSDALLIGQWYIDLFCQKDE